MKEVYVQFTDGIRVDVFNPPKDFDEQIQKAFGEFTEGTADHFTYLDKLYFCDQIVSNLHKAGDSWDAVKGLMIDKFEYDLDNGCDWPDMEYAKSIEFMEECYIKGREDGRMHYQFKHNGIKDHHIYERIMELEYRAIKAVMNWEEE